MPRRNLSLALVCVSCSLNFLLVRHQSNVYAAPARHATLVLDWYPNSDHGGLFTAIRKGFFARRHLGISANVPSDTSAQIALTAAGKADFAITYETDLLAAQSRGVPVRSVMCIVQHPLNTIMTLASSGIRRPRDLAGKTVGAAGTASDTATIAAVMAHDGSSVKQAHIVAVGYNLLAALLAHRVDAVVGVYWTWEAIQARDRGYPVNVMHVEQWGVPNYCELVLVTNSRLIARNPSLVRDTVRGMQEGYAYAERHPLYAWDALHARDKTLDRPLVLKSLMLLRPAIIVSPTIGYQNPVQWRRYARWLGLSNLVSARINVRRAYTNSFLAPGVL